MSAPDVSVVIPFYNGERFVADAVTSVLAQSMTTVEIIIVDDGSSAASRRALESLSEHERVRVVTHEENRGIAAARNTGVRSASGRYVGFLDQDDMWHADKLATQIPRLDAEPGVGLVFSEVDVVDTASGRRTRRRQRVPSNVDRLDTDGLLACLLRSDMVALGSTLIRREHIEAAGFFDESIRSGADDFDLVSRVAGICRFAHVDQALLTRREHGENFTSVRRLAPDAMRIFARIARERPQLAGAVKRAGSRYYYQLARELQLSGERGAALTAFRNALGAAYSLKAFVGLVLCSLGRPGDAVMRWISRTTS